MDDAIIIGGSFAGLAAALQLGRPAAGSPSSIPACRAIASQATRTACWATTTSGRWTSWPRRGSSLRATPRSNW